MAFETSLSAEEQAAVAQRLIGDLVLNHPLPWRIEIDWSQEVRDKDGSLVTSCLSRRLAEMVVQLATDYSASMIVADAETAVEGAAHPDTGTLAGMDEAQQIEERLDRIARGDDPDDLTNPRNR